MNEVESLMLQRHARISFIAVSLLLILFAVYSAAFGVFPPIIQRSVHLGLVLLLVYIQASAMHAEGTPGWRKVFTLSIGAVAFCAVIYQTVFYDEVVSRYGAITGPEEVLATIAIVLVLDATRRVIGWSMVVLALCFLAYAFWGNVLPGALAHRGYGLDRVLGEVYLGGTGLFGAPLGVSATYVIMIVILGALLESTHASNALMDVAVALTGRSRGGPAKAAVVGSSLMGMISGTAVANVLTTGTISIPLMKRAGYRGHVAAAIEAVSSTGGQLMPPVMGAAAFLMADIIEKPYSDIAIAAIIPAALFYLSVFATVHVEALKTGVKSLREDELPSMRRALLDYGLVLLSIPAFVLFLSLGYSVMYASLWAIVCLLALSLIRKASRMGLKDIGTTCLSVAIAILPVATATATAGIIIAVVTLTGLGLKFSSLIVSLSGGNLIFALVLTMASSLVLGMGLPTAAAYILVATLAAPALVDMGVSLLAAHMFVFYSAMLSAITPPVALAAFAAAALSKENPMLIAVTAVKYGVVAFLIPYFFVLNDQLLGYGSVIEVGSAFITASIGAVALACATQGWWLGRMPLVLRIVLFASALSLIFPGMETDLIGLAGITFVGFVQLLLSRSERQKVRSKA